MTSPSSAEPPRTDAPRTAAAPAPGSARAVLGQVLLVVAAFAVVGALAGVVWWWLWTPPTGSVVDRGWYPDETGLRGQFRGTGCYVVVALVAGLLLGALAAWRLDRSELATLAAVLVGSVLAAWLMREVGQHLGPADPQRLARTTTRTRLPGDLRVSGWPPLVTFPLASLLGLCLVDLLTTGRTTEPTPADAARVG